MKLLSFILRPFYRIEVRTSDSQLRLDFGDFPPAPLSCKSLSGQFNVIRTRGIGDVYYELSMILKYLEALESDPQSLSQEFMLYFGADTVQALRSTFDDLKQFPKFVKSAFVAILLGITGLKLITKRALTKPRGLGVFNPAFNDESNVVLRSGQFKGRSDESVVSHEHIHLLQHRDPERCSRHIKCPELRVSEQYLAESSRSSALYLLEKVEVEARLHESVLSFYRVHRRLPTTVPCFLGLLAASPQYGWLVRGVLESQGVVFDQEAGPYPERDVMFVEQFEFTMLSIMDDVLRVRFLTEVLAVMYGNLLRYYGDEAASCAYLENISRPNYYDELYGV